MTTRSSFFLTLLLAFSPWIACAPTAPSQTAASGSPAAAGSVPDAPKPAAFRRAERRAFFAEASTAYERKDFASCASLFASAGDAYQAACCHSLGGDREAAFAQLALAIDGRFRNLAHLDRDSDLTALHGDPRWATERARLVAKLAEEAKRIHPELLRIHDEDQADRAGGSHEKIDWSLVGARDKLRREQVDAILAAGGAKDSADYYHAAMVYQHGGLPEDIERARDLALKAVELDPENDRARWLAAAAEDRKLMYENQPQKWGTQFRKIDGVWVVWQVDPTITDAQRDEWNVPSLAEAQARAARMNAAQPKP